MMKRSATLIITIFLMLLCMSTTSLAEVYTDNSVHPLYTYITKIDGSFSIKNGKAECYGAGRSQYADTTTIVSVTLQKRTTDTTTWSSVCSWSDTQTGKSYAIVSEEKSISKGYDYRILVRCTIKDSEGVIRETDSMYSRVIPY